MTEDEKIKEMVESLAAKFPGKSIAIDKKNFRYVYDDDHMARDEMFTLYVQDLYTETSIETFEELENKYTEIIKGEK